MNCLNALNTALWSLIFCLTFAVCCGSAPAQEEADNGKGNDLIREAYELTKTAESKDALEKVVKLCDEAQTAGLAQNVDQYADKLKSWAHNQLGELALDNEQWDEALKRFGQSVELDDTRWKAYLNRGFLYARAEDFDNAMVDLNRSIELRPENEKAFIYRGDIHYARGEFEKAIADYDRALALNADNAGILIQRGHAYLMLKRPRRALSDFNRAIALDSDNVEALVYRGDLYFESGFYRQASNDYRRAFRLDREEDRTYVSAAWMLATCPDARFRDSQGAVSTAKKAVELLGEEPHPFRFRYLETLAAAHANAGNFEEAVKLQTQAIQTAPKSELEAMKARKVLYEMDQPYRVSNPRQAE